MHALDVDKENPYRECIRNTLSPILIFFSFSLLPIPSSFNIFQNWYGKQSVQYWHSKSLWSSQYESYTSYYGFSCSNRSWSNQKFFWKKTNLLWWKSFLKADNILNASSHLETVLGVKILLGNLSKFILRDVWNVVTNIEKCLQVNC